MAAGTVNMIGQPLIEEMDDGLAKNLLGGILSGGAAGFTVGGLPGMLVGAAGGGVGNAVSEGRALDALSKVPGVGDFFGSPEEEIDPGMEWMMKRGGIDQEDLDRRIAAVDMLGQMGIDPTVAWKEAFGGTALAGLYDDPAAESAQNTQLLQGQLLQSMTAPYAQSMLNNAAQITDPALRQSYEMEAGSLMANAAYAPIYNRQIDDQLEMERLLMQSQYGGGGGLADFGAAFGVPVG
jgi:hypothetical protein